MYWIAICSPSEDGGTQLARVYKGQDADAVARIYNGSVVDYGPTKDQCRATLDEIERRHTDDDA